MDESTDPMPHHKDHRRRNVLVGAVIGAAALAGTVVGVGAVAGAQDSPSTSSEQAAVSTAQAEADDFTFDDFADTDWEAFDECISDQLGTFEETFDDFDLPELDDATIEAWDAADRACEEFLPEDIKAEIAAWEPYEQCIDDQLGDLPDPWVDGEEPTDTAWQAYDEAFEAADEACSELLPEETRAEMEAFEAFDQCLTDAGVFDDGAVFGPVVHVETGDGLQIVEFGEVTGSVTITGDVNGIIVDTDGGVELLDEATLDAEWEAFDAAHEQCEQLLPEELFED